jgi:hypothetical protein
MAALLFDPCESKPVVLERQRRRRFRHSNPVGWTGQFLYELPQHGLPGQIAVILKFGLSKKSMQYVSWSVNVRILAHKDGEVDVG